MASLCALCSGKGILLGGPHMPSVTCNHCQGSGREPELTPETRALGVPEILEEMATTFRARNKQYGDNWKMVGRLLEVMFPNGVRLRTAADYDVWHLFELKVVKLSRFVISGLMHIDSIHDDAVYSAMIEAILKGRTPDEQRCIGIDNDAGR